MEKTEPSKEPYYGDLQKTQALDELFQTLRENRDEAWKASLLANVAEASFACSDPQVIQGPDGFPYFQLQMPEPYKSFTCYVIKNMNEDFLLKEGIGVAIFMQNSQQPEWVFSCGDLLNYHLNGEFYSVPEMTNISSSEVIKQKEEVLTGQPSESYLPKITRELLRKLFDLNEICNARLLLMMRKKPEGISQELVFNLTPDRLKSQLRFDAVMRNISWYLPRHYSISSMKETAFENSFEDV